MGCILSFIINGNNMMTKTNYSLDTMHCGGQQQPLLLGGIHTGINFKKGPG